MVTRPGYCAVLVDQQRHVIAVALHFPQQRVERLGVRHEHRRAHHLRHRSVATTRGRVIRLLDTIFQIHHADDVVDVFADDRNAGVPTAHRHRRRLIGGLVAFNPYHLGTRHHHFAGRSITEFEYRLDHSALVGGDHTALLRHVDDFA